MFKKFLALFLVLFTFSTLLVNVFAQDGTQPPTFCFVAANCSVAGSGCSNGDGHRARLTVGPEDQPLPNSKIYVIMSISTDNGQYYTSGSSDIDEYFTYSIPDGLGFRFDGLNEGLYREDGITPINQTLTNTLTSNASGDLSVSALEWQDYTPQSHARKWFGFSITQPEPTKDPGLGLGAQQQAEIPKVDWAHAAKDCLPLAWDPDGTVFDSQSLEPIPGASVTLLKKRADGTFSFVNKFDPNDVPNGILTNPYSTLEDGGFSFFVPDGTYTLTPKINGYNFPGSLTLNTNYSKVYSNIYPLTTGVEIVEKGGPQHRDIPVDSVGGQPTYFPIKIMEYSYQSDRMSSVFIDGRVSHPLATINAYSVIPDPYNPDARMRYKVIKTVKADKVGRFSLTVNQSTFNKTKSEMFGEIEAIKSDFGLSANDTNKSPAILKLNPILTYIEGNALANGQVLPGAKVELLLNSSTKPYYETVADNQGYFKVPSDYIPFMPYKLRYSLGGVVASVTTSKFITDNSTNINSNKTDLFYPQYNNPKINESIKKSITANNQPSPNKPGSKTNQPALDNFTFLGIVLLIVILLVAVGLLGVYLIKKNQNTPTM